MYPLIFFTDFGVILLDMTFSIMNGERLVIGELFNSIEMNLGKGDSTSSSESVSLKFLLSFFYLHQLLWVFVLKNPYIYF